MSFSPESFDRLLADKLAQALPPAYEPAHWDQLEDQLQHLNHALQAAQSVGPASGPVAAPLAGKLATLGVSALLAGLTAVNGYFFYAATVARQTPTATLAPRELPIPVPQRQLVLPPAPAAVVTLPTPSPRAAAPSRIRLTAPSSAPVSVATTSPAVSEPLRVEAAPAAPVPAAAATVTPVAPASAVASPTDSSTATGRSESVARPAAETPVSRLPAAPNVITPNGDGLNDRFELPLPAGSCRLTVYDRANRVCFTAERYDNAWDGGNLPAGQYLYLIEPTGGRPTPGFLTIVR